MKVQKSSVVVKLWNGAVRPGHYAKKQLLCPNRIIAWSHRRRFKTARKLVKPYASARLLDYGCGDGTFIAEVLDLFPRAVGVDVDLKQTLNCRERFADAPSTLFLMVKDLADSAHTSAYDLVTCMEVLEHCVDNDIDRLLSDLRRLVAASGCVIISVPIEIGPTLLGKQLVRGLAARRRLGDYQYIERYTVAELLTMIFAGQHTMIRRPTYSYRPADSPFHGHKGFNWRSLRRRLQDRFEVSRTLFSPLCWSRGHLSSQTWLLCRPR